MRRTRTAPLAALALSVLAHAVTLSGDWLRLPQTQAHPPPLMVRLEPLAPAAIPLPPPPPVRVTRPALKPRAAPVAAAPATTRSDAPAPWTQPAPEADAAAAAPEAEVPAAVLAQSEPPSSEPVVVATAAPTTSIAPEPAIIKTLPRRGRITYNAIFKRFNAGMSELSWEAIGQAYKIDSKTAPEGLAAWLSPLESLVFHSSGQITERGLLPQQFTSREVRRGVADESAAQFDWNGNQIQFGRAAERKNAALPASSQDLMSMMFQLSLAPPAPGRLQIPVTNGKNFEPRDLDVFAEETIETPMGPLRVLPVKEVRRQGSESREIFFATEYRYLPVRIRFMGRDGAPDGELIVTAIHDE